MSPKIKAMSRRDLFHDHVKEALEKDGWKITHDPYMLIIHDEKGNKRDYPIDLGAEVILAAEKENSKIAIEVKTFGGSSTISDYHQALGQYMDYLVGLQTQEPDRKLYLAISQQAYKEIQGNPLAKLSVEHYGISMIIFDPRSKTILQWIR
ncbi:MAG: XisH family protein [Phaeodactylibacter sp.]|nr:XisH family protein [Phaeodactylibacter sp.]